MSLLSQYNIFWTLFFQSPSSVRYLLSVEFRESSSVIRLKWRSELIESRAPRPSSPAALLSWITACFHIHIVGEAAREAGQRCLEEGNNCTALLVRDRWGSERKAQTGQPKQAAAWCTLHAWDAARINTCSPLEPSGMKTSRPTSNDDGERNVHQMVHGRASGCKRWVRMSLSELSRQV